MKIAVLQGGRSPVEFELQPGKNLIGRHDPEERIALQVDLEQVDQDQKVSRRHAVIFVAESGKATIKDLGSVNGTFLRAGKQLECDQEYELPVGSEFIVGGVLLKLVA
jgi:pSer/pThr/pTyr-binding forkhead associated (FHA) protein